MSGTRLIRRLRELLDVDTTGASPGDALVLDVDGETWIPGAGGGGGGSDDQTAAEVPFTPAGTVAATDVQAAIVELDTEKASTSHVHSGADITTGTVADARIASTIARDSEVSSAVAAEATARDAAIATHEADTTNVHGIADTSALDTVAGRNSAIATSEAGQVRDGDAAGGVLAGTYPSPSFAVDMATQAELDAVSTAAVPTTRTITAGSGLAGGGTLAADRTLDVNVDGSTLEIVTDTVRVKDGGITSAKIADGTIAVGDLAFDPATQAELDAAVATLQPLDSDLTAIAALATTSYGRALLALADAAALRTAAGLVIGTDVQAFDSDLAAFAGLAIAADKLPYGNGSHTLALADFTAAARALLDDADAATMLSTLGVSTFIKTLLDDADAATARATLGVSAGLSHSFLGYNGVGASFVTMTTRRMYAKKITLAADGLLSSVEAHIKNDNSDHASYLAAFVANDSSGAPDLLRAYNPQSNLGVYLSKAGATAGTARWFAIPIDAWLTAGDYWVGVQCLGASGASEQLAFDASVGSDRYQTPTFDGAADFGGLYSTTTTTDKYSIRANVLS